MLVNGLWTCIQDLLKEYSLCHCGHQLPSLRPSATPPISRKKGNSEEEEEETDADVLQRDIIEVLFTAKFVCLLFTFAVIVAVLQGYLRMNLLPRVRYLLEVFFPREQTNSRLQLLEILTRLTQHSTEAASKVRGLEW